MLIRCGYCLRDFPLEDFDDKRKEMERFPTGDRVRRFRHRRCNYVTMWPAKAAIPRVARKSKLEPAHSR